MSEGKILITTENTIFFEIKDCRGILDDLEKLGPGSFKIALRNWGFFFKPNPGNPDLGYLDVHFTVTGVYTLKKNTKLTTSLLSNPLYFGDSLL